MDCGRGPWQITDLKVIAQNEITDLSCDGAISETILHEALVTFGCEKCSAGTASE